MVYLEFILSLLFIIPISFTKKLISRERKFLNDVEIDVRSSNPVSFTLTSQIPTANIYLKITNKSQYLEAIFDRAVFSVWIKSDRGEQPILHQAHIMSKTKIKQKKSAEIFCQFDLNQRQISCLEEIKGSRKLTATLYLDIYIDSSLYHHLFKKVRLENRPCEIQ